MRSDWLVSIKDVPHSPEGCNGQPVSQTNTHGTPTCFRRAVESDGWLRVGVPTAPFAGFKCLNSASLKLFDCSSDPSV